MKIRVNKDVIEALYSPYKYQDFLEHYPDFDGYLEDFLDLKNLRMFDKIQVAARLMPRFLVEVFAIDCAIRATDAYIAATLIANNAIDAIDDVDTVDSYDIDSAGRDSIKGYKAGAVATSATTVFGYAYAANAYANAATAPSYEPWPYSYAAAAASAASNAAQAYAAVSFTSAYDVVKNANNYNVFNAESQAQIESLIYLIQNSEM